MKKYLLLIPILFLSFGFYSYYNYVSSFKDILKQLDLSEEDAKGIIWSDCAGSYFGFPNPKQLKNAAAGERASIVKAVAEYVKDYTTTEEFKQKYAEFRMDRKPTPPEEPKYSEQLKAEYKASLEKGITDAEATKKSLAADQQSIMDQTITMYKQQLADLDKNPIYSKDMDPMIKQGYDMQVSDYNQKVAEWEVQYPEKDPTGVVKKWIQSFLDETKDIDFGAQLQKNKWGQMVFTNSNFESKSSTWKLCYRAGKEATNEARSFAQNWLSELK